MTKKHPVPYLFTKTLGKAAHAKSWARGGKEAVPAREEILAAIKLRLAAKKKKR